VGADLDPAKPYLVVLQHPVTSEYGSGFDQINKTLKAVERIGMQTAWLWPNVDAGSDDISKGLRMYREEKTPDWLHMYRNFSVEDYARLINGAQCLVGNSSSALREGAYLGVPAVNIGNRQQGREHGENVVHVANDAEAISAAISSQISNGRHSRSELFGDGSAGSKIADILASAEINIQKRLAY
jgi:UDP-N-acetylglucosamine 2-epimerase